MATPNPARREPPGDEHTRALETLITTAAPRGLRIATRLIGAADAEDAVQEALSRTLLELPRVREPEAWFIRSLVNHCIGVLRRRRVWRLFSGRHTGGADPPEKMPLGPETLLGDAREAHALRRLVQDLPAMQRAVLGLRYGEELAIAEIARTMGIGEETVKTHIARALGRLRTEVQR
jgi:RNA polymerase sigma-70 factor (ECF subfamily)